MIGIITSNIFQLLIFIGLVVIYFTSKNLLPNYFNEKGKNLATKEDISEITSLVEKVKHNFISETEKLKANLTLLTNIQVGIIAEERNSIIDFNQKYFKWLNILIDGHFENIDDKNNIEIENFSKKIRQYFTEMCNSETKLVCRKSRLIEN